MFSSASKRKHCAAIPADSVNLFLFSFQIVANERMVTLSAGVFSPVRYNHRPIFKQYTFTPTFWYISNCLSLKLATIQIVRLIYIFLCRKV